MASDAKLPDAPAEAAREAFVPDPELAQLTAFGFRALMADFYWLRAVQIVGSEQGSVGRSHTLAALIDVVTTLDPHVGHPYRFAGIWVNGDVAAVRKANRLLERAIANHPDDWRHYFYLAFNHFYYLGDEAAAADALAPAVGMKDAPAYLGRLVARLKAKDGGLDASTAFLVELMRSTQNEQEKAQYTQALRHIETERRARFLDAARAEYVRRFKRDIESVEELLASRVVRELPEDPSGRGWELSEETGEIVSAGIRYRYRLQMNLSNEEKLAGFGGESSQ